MPHGVITIRKEFCGASCPACDYRSPTGHPFDDHHPEWLGLRTAVHDHVQRTHGCRSIVEKPREAHLSSKPQQFGVLLELEQRPLAAPGLADLAANYINAN